MSEIYKSFLANEGLVRRIFARYFHNPQDIDDLTQEIFIRCFAAEMKSKIRDPRSFLLRAAKNLALSERKKKIRTTTDCVGDFDDSEVSIDKGDVSAEERADGQRKLAVLTKALASLPADYRRAFMMRKIDNLKLTQIATRLNVSVSTVQNRVARALAMCDEYLRDQGYDPAEFSLPPCAGQRAKSSAASIVSISYPLGQKGDGRDEG